MPNNSKVILGNEVLIDLTSDTVTPQTLAAGETAHDRSGSPITGTANYYSPSDSASTTINDTDYIPMSESDATTKKKALWSTVVANVKLALGIVSGGTGYLKKDGTWDTPTDSTKVAKAGDTITGNINYKATSIDASKANNNVSSTQYPTTFNILDNASRILARLEGKIESGGNIGSYWYVRNYDTSGGQVAQKGISMTIAKDGTLTYGVSDADKFRSAISAAASNHTHTLSLAEDSGTSSVSLKASTKYKLTAGGSTYIFTTTPNTWRGVQNNLTSDDTDQSLSAAQGKALANGSARDSTKLPLAGGTMTGRILRNITSGTSYINGPKGEGSLLHMNKSEGDIYYAVVSLRTKGGGGWAIGNYNGENLEFTYGTKANITSGTNTTSNVVLRNTAGTIALTSEVSAKVAKAGDTMSGNLTVDRQNGTAGSVQWSYLIAGNNIAKSAAKNSTGVLRLYSGGTSYIEIAPADTNTAYTQTLQATSGTIALTSQLTNGSVTKVGTGTVGSSTKPIFLSSGTPTASSGNVGGDANTPMRLVSGVMTACNTFIPKGGGTFTGNIAAVTANDTTSTVVSRLTLGNATVDGSKGATYGLLRLYSSNTGRVDLRAAGSTSNSTIYLPTNGGTLFSDNGGLISGGVGITNNLEVYWSSAPSQYGDLNIGSGSAGHHGIGFINKSGYHGKLKSASISGSDKTWTLPNTTGTIALTSSSRRVKENIRDITEEEAQKLLDIDIIKFDYKDFWNDGRKNQTGLIAEDVQKIIPEAVVISESYDPNLPVDQDYNFPPEVDYQKFIPYLIKMVQIQHQEINNLKEEIQLLKEDK